MWAYTEWTKRKKLAESFYPKGIEVLLREAARKKYPDPENVDNQRWQSCDCTTSLKSVSLYESWCFRTKIAGIPPTDLFWCFPILVTIRELPFRNISWKVNCEFGSQGWSQEAEDSEKQNSQIKRTGIRLGSRIPIGNEILYMDFLDKVIHGEENNVCLSRTTTFHHYCHLPFWWWHVRQPSLVVVSQARHFVLSLLWRFVNDLGSRLKVELLKGQFSVVCAMWRLGRPCNYPCFAYPTHLILSLNRSWTEENHTLFCLFLVVCFLVPRHERVAHTEHCTSTVWIVTFCVHCHQKQVFFLKLLHGRRNLLVAWLMRLDAGGTFEQSTLQLWCVVPTRADRCGYVLYSNV